MLAWGSPRLCLGINFKPFAFLSEKKNHLFRVVLLFGNSVKVGTICTPVVVLNKFIRVKSSATFGIETISRYKTGITYKREEYFVLCSALNLSSTVA